MGRLSRFADAVASAPLCALEWLDRRPLYLSVPMLTGVILLVLWAVPWQWLGVAYLAWGVYWVVWYGIRRWRRRLW